MPKKKKNPKEDQSQCFEGEKIKYVKRANARCRTYFEGGKQHIEWLIN